MKQSITSSLFFACVIIIISAGGFAQAQQRGSNAHAYFEKGVAHDSDGYYYRAIMDFTKAIKIDPSYVMAYLNRGKVYTYSGRYNEAISDFTKAIQIDPGYAMAYYTRGITYYLKKEYAKAWNDISKVRELDLQIHPIFLKMLKEDSGRER